MTNEIEYYGGPEIEFADPSELAGEWHPNDTIPDSTFFKLKQRDLLRILQQAGPRAIAVFCAIAVHCNRDQTCWPSKWTLARLAGCRNVETVEAYIDKLVTIAAIERVPVRGRDGFRVITSDAPPEPFIMISREWMERFVASVDIWAICGRELAAPWRQSRKRGRKPTATDRCARDRGLAMRIGPVGAAVFWLIQATAAGRRVFFMPAKELAAQCGLSGDQFRRIAAMLRDCGLIDYMPVLNNTRWTMPAEAIPQKSCGTPVLTPQKSCATPQKSCGTPVLTPQKSCLEVDLDFEVEQDQGENGAGAKDATLPDTPLPSLAKPQEPEPIQPTQPVRSVVVVTDYCGNQFSVRDPRDRSQRPVSRICDDGELQAVLTRRDGSKVLIYVEGERIVRARDFTELVEDVCAQLYRVTPRKYPYDTGASFDGRNRQAIADMLLDHYGDDIVAAFGEFVRSFDEFQMRNADSKFVSGGAKNVFANWDYREQAKPAKTQVSAALPVVAKKETRNEELAEALANPIQTWQPSGQAAA
jgi:hypothetical protein